MERAVKPFVLFKLQPFGAVDTYVVRLRRFQRVLVSRSLGNYRLPEETYKTFLRRCSADARHVIGSKVSDWGTLWIKSTLSWDQHLQRDFEDQQRFLEVHPQNDVRLGLQVSVWQLANTQHIFQTSFSWAAALSRHRGASWFQNVRTFFRNGFRTASRTNTRSARGYVQCRWHDVVSSCRENRALLP